MKWNSVINVKPDKLKTIKLSGEKNYWKSCDHFIV